MLDESVATVGGLPVEKEKRGGHRQREYASVYGRMMKDARSQIAGSLRKLVKC